jgi:hypothetical protein
VAQRKGGAEFQEQVINAAQRATPLPPACIIHLLHWFKMAPVAIDHMG